MKPIWIIRRYVSLEYLRWFLFCLTGFVSIAVIVDLFENAGTFLKYHAGMSLVARYELFQLPQFVDYLIAPTILIAMVVALTGMTRRNEVTAMLAGGVGRRSIVAPMALISLALCVGEFALSEYVLPEANAQRSFVDDTIRGRTNATRSDRRNRWFAAGGGFLRVQAIDADSKVLHGILLLLPSPTAKGAGTRIEGSTAEWNPQEQAWDLRFDVRVTSVDSSGQLAISNPPELRLPIALKPEDLSFKAEASEEWSVRDLRRIIRERELLKQDARPERIELESRFVFPLAGFMMALLGAPFAFKDQRKGGVEKSFLIGISIPFTYYIVLRFGVARLATTAGMPPILAAWTPNLIFGPVAVYLFSALESV